MPSNVVIVDDRDSLIQYDGSWNNAGATQEFHGTTRWASQAGSTASLTFSGSSVTVYGSVAAKNPAVASLNFVIDNSITGFYTPANDLYGAGLYHEALWTSPSMSEGQHTLVITQSKAADEGQIYIDYLMYNTASASSGPCFIDDRDPRITYTPAWRQFGSQNDFQHTSQESTSIGDSFSFQFEGTQIQFYGGLTSSDLGLMKASIVLDGGAPVIYNAPDDLSSTTNNLIYTSDILAAGTHRLVVTAETEQTMWTDYFLLTPNPTSSPSSPSTPASPANPSGTHGTSSVPAGSPASVPSGSHSVISGSHTVASSTHLGGSGASSDASSIISSGSSSLSGALPGSSGSNTIPLSTSSKSTPTAAIVGAILGAVILIALLGSAIFCVRRRRQRQQGQSVEEPMANVPTASPLATRGAATSQTALTSAYAYSESVGATSTSDLEYAPSHAQSPFVDATPSDAAQSQSGIAFDSAQGHSAINSISNLPYTTQSFARESTTSGNQGPLPPLVQSRRNSKLAAEARWQQHTYVSVIRSGADSISGSSRIDGEEAPPQYAA